MPGPRGRAWSGAGRPGAERGGPARSRSAPRRPGCGGGPGGPGLRCCAACVVCLPRSLPSGSLLHLSVSPFFFFFLSFPLFVPFFPPRGAVRPAPSQRDARLCQSQTNGKVPRSSSGFHFEILPRILFVPALITLTWKRSPALHGRSQGRRKRRPRSAPDCGHLEHRNPGRLRASPGRN